MALFSFESGLSVAVPSPPPEVPEEEVVITEEAGITPPAGSPLRVVPLVEPDAVVAQGAPVARLRDAPEVCFVAPMASRVARIDLLPGRVLSEIVLFREGGGDRITHAVEETGTEQGLRHLMQSAGAWPWIRRRPFGGMPSPSERPAAIVVMATDTRPHAPDPRLAVKTREGALSRGLSALSRLTEGPVYVVAQDGPQFFEAGLGGGRVRPVRCGRRHPQGSAGMRIHDLVPAGPDHPVWDIHAEDVAALGDLLKTGQLPMTRLVSVAGSALRAGRLVWTQPGADLRSLTHRFAKPGPHFLMSGSALDGHEARWLATMHRQVTATARETPATPQHWIAAALTRSPRPRPAIPTAALDHAFGKGLPAASFVRALGSGNDDDVIRLGGLSLLEEDLALVDYVLGGKPRLADLLRGSLNRIRVELGI